MKNANASILLNILTAITMLVPFAVRVDAIVSDDVLDARDSWDMVFRAVETRAWLQQERGVEIREDREGDMYPGDGRFVRIW